MTVLALLVGAPAALASTATLRGGTTVVYTGDPTADTVTLSRYLSGGDAYYIVTDGDGITPGTGCVRARIGGNNTDHAACFVSPGLKRYEINAGGGDDTVRFDGVARGRRAAPPPAARRTSGPAPIASPA